MNILLTTPPGKLEKFTDRTFPSAVADFLYPDPEEISTALRLIAANITPKVELLEYPDLEELVRAIKRKPESNNSAQSCCKNRTGVSAKRPIATW